MDRVARRGPLAQAPGALKGDTSEIDNIFVAVEGVLSQNIKKLNRGKFLFSEKISQCRKKLKGVTLRDFPTSILSQNSKKLKRDPLGEKKISGKKSRSAEKNWKGDPLVSSGMVCYAGKQEKLFWFSSLDQIVHFRAIIFCRTFVELFWSVRVDWKKATIIAAFHFMKRRLKKYIKNSAYFMRNNSLTYTMEKQTIEFPNKTTQSFSRTESFGKKMFLANAVWL